MRALQERIRELEDTQASLISQLQAQEVEGSNTESMWRSRLSQELQLAQERDRQTQKELNSVHKTWEAAEAELKAQVARGDALQGEVDRLNESLKAYQKTSLKTEKQVHQQVEAVNAQLRARSDELARTTLSLQQAMHDKQLMLEELQHTQGLVRTLEGEVDRLKEQEDVRLQDIEKVGATQHTSTLSVDYTRKHAELSQQLRRQDVMLKSLGEEKALQDKLIAQLNTDAQELRLKLQTTEAEKDVLRMD